MHNEGGETALLLQLLDFCPLWFRFLWHICTVNIVHLSTLYFGSIPVYIRETNVYRNYNFINCSWSVQAIFLRAVLLQGGEVGLCGK